jgi:hypothetical protein
MRSLLIFGRAYAEPLLLSSDDAKQDAEQTGQTAMNEKQLSAAEYVA